MHRWAQKSLFSVKTLWASILMAEFPIVPISIDQYPSIPFSLYDIQCPCFQEGISPDFFQYPISLFLGLQRPKYGGSAVKITQIIALTRCGGRTE